MAPGQMCWLEEGVKQTRAQILTSGLGQGCQRGQTRRGKQYLGDFLGLSQIVVLLFFFRPGVGLGSAPVPPGFKKLGKYHPGGQGELKEKTAGSQMP